MKQDQLLKKEKNEMIEMLFEKINKVKSNNTLKEIAQKVDALNDILNSEDSKIENLIDTLSFF